METGKTSPVSPEGVANCVASGDGKVVAATDAQGKLMLYPVDGGQSKEVHGDFAGLVPIRFGTNGALYVSHPNEFPLRIFEINLTTDKRQVIAELKPGDAAGLIGISPVAMSPDANAYAYSYRRTLTELYLVEGLK
jgi:tricorn protease-like protein